MSSPAHDDLVPPIELIDAVLIGPGDFRVIGEQMVGRYLKNGWIRPDHTFLDVGCGLGRMARPLVGHLSPSGRYIGFDINRTSIDWCKVHYARYPNFRFEHLDAMSVVYNPRGLIEADAVRFPLEDASIDFVHMSSVFTHMWPKDVAAYLKEVSRVMRPGARCAITYFLLDPLSKVRADFSNLPKSVLGARNWHPIPGGYLRNKAEPEDVVILDECMVRTMYGEAGLMVANTLYGGWARDTRGPYWAGGDSQDIIDAIKP